ncbi:MAG: aldo/keto reductase [Monoglobales bacterium]
MRYSEAFGQNSSKILLGTTYFGDTISGADSFKILDKYYELGGNHIDCARMYAGGEAEKGVGRWLKSRNPKNIIVSTKGGFPDPKLPEKSRLSEREIRFDVEASLKALDLECIDFYWLHRDDETIPCEEIILMMNSLVREGKIKHFGASNWKHKRIDEANKFANENSLAPFEASQIRFSPAIIAPGGANDPTLVDMNRQEFEYYKSMKMPVAAFASQGKGFFSKLASLGEEGLSPKSRARYYCRENLETFEIIKTLAAEYHTTVAAVVCAALCSIDVPQVFPIIGGSNPMQIEESMAGGDLVLKSTQLKKIFRIIYKGDII